VGAIILFLLLLAIILFAINPLLGKGFILLVVILALGGIIRILTTPSPSCNDSDGRGGGAEGNDGSSWGSY
jgi:hypothetical protein